ncbi:hypothetical protein MPSEU_000080400 [Mayamaea pseudoterrestris]|nr:hypothetical protein MPSEU_000080400 [Mayamaea pseudoterrestris]
MNWFKKEDPKELARKAKRETKKEVRSNQRDLDREIRDLERQEKQTILELKQRAKVCSNQNDPSLKALAKQICQIREQRSKITSTKAQLSALGMSAQVQASQMAAVSALSSVTDAMKSANSVMDMKKTTKIMASLQKESMTAKVREEMMDDVLADVFDSEGMEDEADLLASQVLAELGVEMDSQMVGLNAPSQKMAQEEADLLDDMLPDLKARLNAL